MSTRPRATTRARVRRVAGDQVSERVDRLATEEPLEIRLLAGAQRQTVAITMRTPGNDFELAAGFLFCEGIITSRAAVKQISYCIDPELDSAQHYNIVNVALRQPALPELARLERHFYTTSACGVCGKASIEALRVRGCAAPPEQLRVPARVLAGLTEQLRAGQGLFSATGGLHAAGLFDTAGRLIEVREDVGRHNALDKLIGWALLQSSLPLRERIVLVSGRASFEIVQKCLAAGVAIVCAVSAPSSLAVQLAHEFGITLVGFLRGQRFNVYSGPERLHLDT